MLRYAQKDSITEFPVAQYPPVLRILKSNSFDSFCIVLPTSSRAWSQFIISGVPCRKSMLCLIHLKTTSACQELHFESSTCNESRFIIPKTLLLSSVPMPMKSTPHRRRGAPPGMARNRAWAKFLLALLSSQYGHSWYQSLQSFLRVGQ